MFINYYEILNVSESATSDEIKKSYRREIMKWHPDRNKSPDAHEHSILINEAYSILRDSDKRKRYNAELANYRETLKKHSPVVQNNTENSDFYKKHSSTFNEEFNNNYTYTGNRYSESGSRDFDEYEFKDKELQEWIKNARIKAQQAVKQSIEDLLGMSSTATGEFFSGFFISLVLLVVFAIVMQLFRG